MGKLKILIGSVGLPKIPHLPPKHLIGLLVLGNWSEVSHLLIVLLQGLSGLHHVLVILVYCGVVIFHALIIIGIVGKEKKILRNYRLEVSPILL